MNLVPYYLCIYVTFSITLLSFVLLRVCEFDGVIRKHTEWCYQTGHRPTPTEKPRSLGSARPGWSVVANHGMGRSRRPRYNTMRDVWTAESPACDHLSPRARPTTGIVWVHGQILVVIFQLLDISKFTVWHENGQDDL